MGYITNTCQLSQFVGKRPKNPYNYQGKAFVDMCGRAAHIYKSNPAQLPYLCSQFRRQTMDARKPDQAHSFIMGMLRAGLILILCLGMSGAPKASASEGPEAQVIGSAPVQAVSLSGWFSIVWGDGRDGGTTTTYLLTGSDEKTSLLEFNEQTMQSLGGVLQFDRQYVQVTGSRVAAPSSQGGLESLQVASIRLANGSLGSVTPQAITGSRPWVTIMCKFSDHPEDQKTLDFFQGMYSSNKPGLDHYWREQSYELLNVVGSTAYGWFTLPHPESYYNPTDTQGGANSYLSLLAQDCTAAADASVYFPTFSGINMMFNTDYNNGIAQGGGTYLTLDGLNQIWRVTWEPPWAYSDISVIEHEMGHGWGLPHSSGNYGQTYDNAWDVMSWDRYNRLASTDPTYGCMAQHTISYHKDILGWIPGGQKFNAGEGINTTITLEQLALPQTGNYLMAQIPIAGSSTHFYTVEARQLTGYDAKLTGNAIIIHDVDLSRGIPAHVIDIDGNGNTSDAGAMWTVGETFTDTTNGIAVSMVSATATGFQVTITTENFWSISGYVRTGTGAGVSGVAMNGLPNSPVTDASGFYNGIVQDGWSGTVTPVLSPITFDPASRTYSNITSDQTSQNYTDTYHTGILYVKTAATGTGDCATWANACTLQTALGAASSGEEIWAAAGTYKPTATTDRALTFQLHGGVGVYGGFAGTETQRTQRNPAANPTILSGDIGTPGVTTDNVYHVVTGADGTTLDGFTITAGNADGTSIQGLGGGMLNYAASPSIVDVTFEANLGTYGAGMGNLSSSPVLTNVRFNNNAATTGGGMYNQTNANASLTNVTFTGNSANTGAGIDNYQSSPVMSNVTFTSNTASSNGGGMYNYNQSNPSLTQVSFNGNTSSGDGGGMSNWSTSNPILTDVTFTGNHSTSSGGGMLSGSSSPTLTRVTFSNNSAGNYGGGFYIQDASASLTNVTFSGNHADQYGGGLFSSNGNSTLIEATMTGNSGSWGGALILFGSSPAIHSIIAWGNTSTNGGQIYYDGSSSPTVTDSVIQGGFTGGANIINSDPRLGSLANYGGYTQTLPLLPGSAAINTGNNSFCSATDQRGLARPQAGQCDMGAFESRPFSLNLTGGNNQNTLVNTAFAQPLTLSIAGTGGDPVNGGVVTFSAPGGGASATFTSSTITISSGAAGTNASANGTAGAYDVSANASGATSPVVFHLTNNPPAATSTFTSSPTWTFTQTNTSSPTQTYTPTNTSSPTSTFTPTNTASLTRTSTPTNTSSPTRTFTPTNNSSPTRTFTPSQTYTPSRTPTGTQPTATNTLTPSRTFTPSSTATLIPTSSPTRSVTHTPTATHTPTQSDQFKLFLPYTRR
jgi:M6 family metalloprotease-like protein